MFCKTKFLNLSNLPQENLGDSQNYKEFFNLVAIRKIDFGDNSASEFAAIIF